MRSLVKIAVAGALLASGATAYADVATPTTGNGELVLFVRDMSNESRVYARGLGITLDQLLTQGQITGDPTKPNSADPPNNFADTDTLTYSLPERDRSGCEPHRVPGRWHELRVDDHGR